MKTLCTFLLLLALAAPALALSDSPANREIQARRYLEATPPKALFQDMAEKVSATLPPQDRELFVDLLTKYLDTEALLRAMKRALVNHFTAEELKALADFYGSTVGKSAMSKFGAYMAEVMPAIEQEMAKAFQRANQEAQGGP